MGEAFDQSSASRKTPAIKALGLAVFVVCAIVMVRFTPVMNYLTADELGRFLDKAGFWAPLVFIVVYAVGIILHTSVSMAYAPSSKEAESTDASPCAIPALFSSISFIQTHSHK